MPRAFQGSCAKLGLISNVDSPDTAKGRNPNSIQVSKGLYTLKYVGSVDTRLHGVLASELYLSSRASRSWSASVTLEPGQNILLEYSRSAGLMGSLSRLLEPLNCFTKDQSFCCLDGVCPPILRVLPPYLQVIGSSPQSCPFSARHYLQRLLSVCHL